MPIPVIIFYILFGLYYLLLTITTYKDVKHSDGELIGAWGVVTALILIITIFLVITA